MIMMYNNNYNNSMDSRVAINVILFLILVIVVADCKINLLSYSSRRSSKMNMTKFNVNHKIVKVHVLLVEMLLQLIIIRKLTFQR